MDVSRKGVFLTGGAQGIGRAISEALLKRGARVFFCDVNAATGKATEAELQKQHGGDTVTFEQCDVTNADQLSDVFNKAVVKLGAVDVCVNNAGILDERTWELMLAINTTAQIRGSKLALEHMRRDKGGRGGVIINTVSVAGLTPSNYHHPVYNASKHAMIGFTQTWAACPMIEEIGVRWACLCPGPVNTTLFEMEEDQVMDVDSFLNEIKDSKVKPEDVAEAFMSLLTDENSNGALMSVMLNHKGGKYKRRQLVDADGASKPTFTDVVLSDVGFDF